MTKESLKGTTAESYLSYCQTYYDTDTIQKRILHSNLSDEDKIYLIEKLSEKSSSPIPNTPWITPPPIYCRDVAKTTTSNNTEEVYLTERCKSR